MRHYLKFHFDPGFDRRKLAPRRRQDGTVDLYDLGYVQNVMAGEVVAQWLPADQAPPDADPRAFYSERVFPYGLGCTPDPGDPDRLVSTVNGYVAFDNGRITVRRSLVVPGDVDFHTGNIMFVGDVTVEGAVRAGFEVVGRNVVVRGVVEGARIRATESLVAESGIKGSDNAVVRAGGNLRAKFCENAELHAGKNLLVDTSAMLCHFYVGERLAVKERLVGGTATCQGAAYVGEALGGGLRTQTKLLLGYDPELISRDRTLRKKIHRASERVMALRREAGPGGRLAREAGEQLAEMEKRLAAYQLLRHRLWLNHHGDADFMACRVIVPGVIGANVEIGIGEAVMDAPDGARDVLFRYFDGDVVMSSPAVKR
ncbi:MAG: FapA family protein [Desulfovibrionaceae bacterium]|nr:FapA family protein [Desulfovibrionaceae bacterium]